MRAYGTNPQIWGGDPACDHRLKGMTRGKVLTGGTGKASRKQVTNAGSQYGNEVAYAARLAGLSEAEVQAMQTRADAWIATVNDPASAWEAERRPAKGGSSANASTLNGAQTSDRYKATIEEQYQPKGFTSATCTLCGAWMGELGSEPIPDCLAWARGEEPCSQCYICHLVTIFRLVRTVLRDDGLLYLNLGGSYAGSGRGPTGHNGIGDQERRQGFPSGYERDSGEVSRGGRKSKTASPTGFKAKDWIPIPWLAGLALQADGWWLRQDLIWRKPSCMPESVDDRCTNSHEYLLMLSKQANYYYDAEAVREPVVSASNVRDKGSQRAALNGGRGTNQDGVREWNNPAGRNKRSVWDVTAEPSDVEMCTACETIYSGRAKRRIKTKEVDGKKKRICPKCGETDSWLAHFASYPTKLVEPCVLAGTSQAGQCPECGAPYRRVVEKATQGRGSYHDHGNDETQGMSQTSPNKLMGNGFYEQYEGPKTVGWEPWCKCNAGDPVPQIVCDPFMGSGTTAYVARQYGRRSVGVELNGHYIKLAAHRLKQTVLFPESATVVEQRTEPVTQPVADSPGTTFEQGKMF